MNPGRELDALIESKVMGPKPTGCLCGHGEWCRACSSMPLMYSTSIEAAWQVVERFQGKGWFVKVHNCERQDQWFALITDPMNEWTALAPTAPHAICLAALRAIE